MRTAVETVFALLTLADVGTSLDDARPTLVLTAGRGDLRFLNAAAATHLGIGSLDAAFGTVPALDPAVLRQALRFAERATAGTSGLELLRVPNGLRTAVVGCRMTHLGAPAGEPVVLMRLEGLAVRGGPHDIAGSLALLAAEDRLLAAFDAEGDVLAASGDYRLLEGAQDEIEDFVVAAADTVLARKTVRRGDTVSEALVVRIAGDRDLRLIAIEPADRDAAATASIAPAAATGSIPVAVEPDHMLDPIFFALSPLPTPDDYAAWQTDARREAAAAPGSPEIEAEVAAFAAELGGATDDEFATPSDDGAGPDEEDGAALAGSVADGEAAPDRPAAPDHMEEGTEPFAVDHVGLTADAAGIPGAEPAVVPDDGAPAPRFPGSSPEDLRLAVELVTSATAAETAAETVAGSAAAEPSPAMSADGIAPAGPASSDDTEAASGTEAASSAEAASDAEPEAAVEDGFVFAPEPRPRRFVWQMDADERFTFVSDDFRAAVGPRAADLVGATWSELRTRFGVDRDGIVAAALARRDTWSGLTALWPVEGEALRIPVDLAALPAFGRRRTFEGYRGFGVCRAVEAVPDPSGTGLRLLLEDLVPEPPDGDGPTVAVKGEAEADQPAENETANAAVPISSMTDPDAIASVEPAAETVGAPPAVTDTSPEDESTATRFDPEVAAVDAPDETETPPVVPSVSENAETDAAFAGEIDRPGDASESYASTAAEHLPEAGSEPEPLARAEIGLVRSDSSDLQEPAPSAQPVTVRPDAPARQDASGGSRVVTVPANRGSRIVTLPTAHRSVPDRNRLSGPERIAFRQIAAALGARIEGEDAHPTARTAEPSADDTPADEDRPASFGLLDTGPTVEAADGAPSETRDEPSGPTGPGESPVTDADTVAASAVPDLATLPELAPVVAIPSTAAVAEPDVDGPTDVPLPGAAGRSSAPAQAESSSVSTPVETRDRDEATERAPLLLAEPSAAEPAAGRAAPASERTAADDETATVMRILDRLPVGCAVLKDDGLAHVNEAFLTLLGHPDRATFEAAGGLDAIFAGEHVGRRFVEEGQVRPIPVIARTGAVVPVAARMAGIPWGAGSAVLLTLDRMPRQTIEPVTETVSGRAALDALGEARERANELEAVVDTATDGVLMLDVDGRVLSANRAAEALFGMERAEMAGRPLVDLLAPESRRSAQDYLDGLARNGVASVLNDGREVIGQVPPDGLIPLFMTIGRISSGSGSKFCAVLRDITQWKKSEEELTGARRRAEEASSHKSEFLAKISHEIRTPLNAIIGFSEVMLDERFGPIGSDRYKDYLRDIHTSGSHIMSLINDLLDLSKVEAGKMELKFEAVSLADIAGECVALMQPQANRERIIIRTSLPTGVPAVVADGRSVRQIILNLLSNAVKFTPAGGQVIVSTALEDSGEVVVRVRDTGFGMSEKEIQAALEPFRQLHTTRVRSGGTGLGLPLTKALVEANRATFRIDSVVNQGTLVSITFPVTRVLAG